MRSITRFSFPAMLSGVSALVATPLFPVLPVFPVLHAQTPDSVVLTTQRVADGVYLLLGDGGNIGVSTGKNGIFLIDDQYAPVTGKIRAAVAAIDSGPIRFILNTHWHGDHTGGNENFANAGVLIVAHENVRKRMSVDQFLAALNDSVKASPEAALPVVTFTDTVTFYLNGDTITSFHVKPAHTDGDAIIHFRRANVIHMGDTYFNGFYPFIDLSSGGSIDGMIAAADRILAIAGPETKIIPGHGPLSNRSELQAYRQMLVAIRDRIKKLVQQKRTLAQVQAARPSADYDEKWGKGFMKPEQFVEIVYRSLGGS